MRGHRSRLVLVVCLAAVMAVVVAACGSDSSSGGGGGSSGGAKITGAKTIDPKSMDNAKGNVTYCTGKDPSGGLIEGGRGLNKAKPRLTAKLLEFPESADEQRNQFTQRQRAKSADCDVFESDVVWTAEFRSQKRFYDIT